MNYLIYLKKITKTYSYINPDNEEYSSTYDFENLSFTELILFLLRDSCIQNLILDSVNEQSITYDELCKNIKCFGKIPEHFKFYKFSYSLTTLFKCSKSEIQFLSKISYLHKLNDLTLNILLSIYRKDEKLASTIRECFNYVEGFEENKELKICITDFSKDRFEILLNCILAKEKNIDLKKIISSKEWKEKCNFPNEIYKAFTLYEIEKYSFINDYLTLNV